jgi:hypothetical protein
MSKETIKKIIVILESMAGNNPSSNIIEDIEYYRNKVKD